MCRERANAPHSTPLVLLAATAVLLGTATRPAARLTPSSSQEAAREQAPADVLRSMLAALEGFRSVQYVAREVGEQRSSTTRITAMREPFRFRAESLDATPGTIADVAVSDGTTTHAIVGGESTEAPTFIWDGQMMVTVMDGTTAVALTYRLLLDHAFIRAAVDSGNLIDAGIDDIEGDLCHVVLYARNVHSREDFHSAAYYWISTTTGLPRAVQSLRRIRGQTRLNPQYIISELRLDPPVGDATFTLPATLEAPDKEPEDIAAQPGGAAGQPGRTAASSGAAPGGGTAGAAADPAEANAAETSVPASGFVGWIGRPLPALDLRDLDYQPFDVSTLRGRRFVLNFWAPWCGPCHAELPVLQEILGRYAPKLEIIAVAVQDSRINVRRYLGENPGLPFTFLTDPDMQRPASSLLAALGIEGIPVTFFIDRDGTVADAWFGFTDRDLLVERIQALMERQP